MPPTEDRPAAPTPPSRPLIVGVGNPLRGDDGVGPAVVRCLKDAGFAHARLLESKGEPAALMAAWQDADLVVLIDAAASGAAPGTIHRFDATNDPLPPALAACSSHALGLGEAIKLARALGQLPARLIVYAVEGADFAIGATLSAPVSRAVAPLLARLEAEVRGR